MRKVIYQAILDLIPQGGAYQKIKITIIPVPGISSFIERNAVRHIVEYEETCK